MENNYRVVAAESLVLVSVNPKLYSVEAVMMASNEFLNEAYVLIDGKADEDILVKLRPKQKLKNNKEYGELAMRFNNELIRSSFYIQQSSRTAELRKVLLQTSLLANLVDSPRRDEVEKDDAECETCQSEEGVMDSQGKGDKEASKTRDYASDAENIRAVKNYEKEK